MVEVHNRAPQVMVLQIMDRNHHGHQENGSAVPAKKPF